MIGALLGCVSAVGYTAANGFLKASAEAALDPIWVSTIKTLPTILGAFPWLAWSWWRGQRLFPPWRVVFELLIAGLFGQLAGNVLFQWSLGALGLAITVPLCFGAIICSSVLLGRIWLHESVTPRTLGSVGLIVAAIWILSLSARDVHGLPSSPQATPTYLVVLSIGAACVSGSAYGVLGMVIRRAAMEGASVAATTFLVAGVGTVSLSLLSFQQHGFGHLQQTTVEQWGVMVAAGVCNFIAFVALTRALQVTSLIFVNAINATQVALASVLGVVLFGEPVSVGLILGATLTACGLLIMPRKTARSAGRPQPPDVPYRDSLESYLRPSAEDSDLGVRKSENRDSSDESCVSSQPEKASSEPRSETPSLNAELTLADEFSSGAE